jgi:4-amino-4-deoxy-L-arabinose transferase-like glycosyltransferase
MDVWRRDASTLRVPLAIAIFSVLAALFLFANEQAVPIILWDESRNIVNALEMRTSGFGVVTTYGFEPDLWNTKPPLLIWLMYGSAAIFGSSEWALRLPSTLAALATLVIVICFVHRVSKSLGTGLAAGTILLLSPGFYSDHGARTADYDALLLFFTTGSLQLLFFALHRRRPGIRLSMLIGGLLAFALLTKSIAGLIPMAGVPLYLFAMNRWRRPFNALPNYLLMAVVALMPILIYCTVRELQAPGYLAAVSYNDVVGRFQQTLIGRETSSLLYIDALFLGWFFAGPLLILSPLIFNLLRGQEKALFVYALIIAGTQIAICSISATRLVHYMLPSFPWLAIVTALGGAALWRRYRKAIAADRAATASVAVISLTLCLLLQSSIQWRYHKPDRTTEANYGALLNNIANRGYPSVTVIEPGFALEEDHDPHYEPRLNAYRMIWAEQGLAVDRQVDMPAAVGAVVASCNGAVVKRILREGSDIGGVTGCAAIERVKPS